MQFSSEKEKQKSKDYKSFIHYLTRAAQKHPYNNYNNIQKLDKIKETPNILASILKHVLNNQSLTYFNAICLRFVRFDMFI